MLDVALRNLAFSRDRGFALRDVTLTFARSTHTALIGAPFFLWLLRRSRTRLVL